MSTAAAGLSQREPDTIGGHLVPPYVSIGEEIRTRQLPNVLSAPAAAMIPDAIGAPWARSRCSAGQGASLLRKVKRLPQAA
ncbi:MAG: hypothetical protein WA005_06460 [Candidatus Binataceae bacterium]